MEILYTRKRKHDSDNTDETALLTAERNNDSKTTAAWLIKKLISAVEGENEDIVVKSTLDKIFNTSDIFVKRWSSDPHPEKQQHKFEIWRDAMYMAMEKDTRHSEEIMRFLTNWDIIWSLETKINNLLLHRLIDLLYERKVYDKELRLGLIEMLLKYGNINVNSRDEKGKTALHLAQEGNLTSLLIRYGADVNAKNSEGRTPSMRVWYTRASVLESILKKARTSVALDAVDSYGRTALMIAASKTLQDEVEWLLEAGASVDLSDHLGFTALHHALYTGFDHYDHFPRNTEELKKRKEILTILFAAKDVEWDESNEEKIAKRMRIVKMLLRREDTNVNALSFEKFSPLDIAEACILETQSPIKDALIEKGATLNVFRQPETQPLSSFHLDVRCRFTLQHLLCNASRKGEGYLPVDLFEKRLLTLIEAFRDVIKSGKDQKGRTALHLVAICLSITWAVSWSFRSITDQSYPKDLANKIVEELIAIGCSVNETDIYGRTPLHYADKILKDLLISHEADVSIKDSDGNTAIDEMSKQSSTKPSDIVVESMHVDRNEYTYFLRQMNNKQMEIGSYDDRDSWLKTVPRLLWDIGKYAFRHTLIEQITKEVKDLMSAIAIEIERLDPRLAARPEFVGSSNERTRLDKPDEFDFCFVLTKISELCEVSQTPELPTGFVRLKRKPIKVGEESDFDSLFGEDGILNTRKLNGQFTTILRNALVNIESQQNIGLHWNLGFSNEKYSDAIKKVSKIMMIKPLNASYIKSISIDIVPCIHIDDWWPDEAISNVSDEIKKFGCNLIFESPQQLYPWTPYSESCARISFAKAESDMIKHSCDNAREAYMIGKMMFEKTLSSSSYILKNCLLYCIEALAPTSEKASQLGLSLEEMESKFHQMGRYLWLKCLMKCHLEFVAQDFCPCYFLPDSSSPVGTKHLKEHFLNWMTTREFDFPKLCRKAYAFYRCTSNESFKTRCTLSAPDPLWERFDRNQLIARLSDIAYTSN